MDKGKNMTELKIGKKSIPTASMSAFSSLPPIAFNIELDHINEKFLLGEDDGLFINYGKINGVFPYRYQDCYTRTLSLAEYDIVVLENEYLKATFMPCFGGKLWSLYDKKAGKELLFANSVVRPGNLSTRKAWLSGGIEWNGGFKGHGPYTCAPIHTAKLTLDDGTPVLRFYYLERIRRAVIQMDFFLPNDSPLLYARMRLTNPNDEVIPMYWWSNIAVEEKEGDRVIVPAVETYSQVDGNVVKFSIPKHNGIDVTYPANNVTSIDYFWKTQAEKQKYIFQSDKDGYGLFQTSTARLKGRKLFVWGNSQGGHKWMNFLTADDESGRYDEIQCGLAATQYESLPMPPHTVWEWLETYGALQVDASKAHGEWQTAREETETKIQEIITVDTLEKMLTTTRGMAKRKAEKVLFRGDGWGALELKTVQNKKLGLMCDYLDFGETDEEQAAWEHLLLEGTLGEHSTQDTPNSYIRGAFWKDALLQAIEGKDKENWYAWYQLGVLAIAEERYEEAETYLQQARALQKSAWTEYAMGVLCRKTNRRAEEQAFMLAAYAYRSEDLCLAKEVFLTLHELENAMELIRLYENAKETIQKDARCKFYYAFALARVGKTEQAEEILYKKTPLVIPDLRECETSMVDLWNFVRKKKGLEPAEPPKEIDFRMFAGREAWLKD